MCHSTGLKQQSEQIEKFIENGMPKKIIKNVNFILNRKKKEANSEIQQNNLKTLQGGNVLPTSSSLCLPQESILKCPFNGNKMAATNENIFMKEKCSNVVNSNHIKITASILENPNFRSTNETIEKLEVYVDALSICTQWTKTFVEQIHGKVQKLQRSKLNTFLTKTTQPAHIVAFAVVSALLIILGPDLFETSCSKSSIATNKNNKNDNIIATIFYIGAFATHFGSQIWMTFVSGLSLYFSLPRHTFGQCQQILFPKYFALNAILSIVMLVVFVKYLLDTWTLMNSLQIIGLSLSAFIAVTVRLYLAPPMLRLMHEKYKIEDAVGSGNEIGNIDQGDLVQCPHYLRIHKMFRRIHMTIAIGNMTVLMCTCLNLYFLASKIKFS